MEAHATTRSLLPNIYFCCSDMVTKQHFYQRASIRAFSKNCYITVVIE